MTAVPAVTVGAGKVENNQGTHPPCDDWEGHLNGNPQDASTSETNSSNGLSSGKHKEQKQLKCS